MRVINARRIIVTIVIVRIISLRITNVKINNCVRIVNAKRVNGE